MSRYLVVDELYDGVTFSQLFKISRDTNAGHIRPYVYKQGTIADGEMVCEVYQNGTLLAESRIITDDLNAAPLDQPYSYGFIRFDFDSLSLHVLEGEAETEYELRFYMDNHTTDTNNFIAIARSYDHKTYPTYGDEIVDNQAPNDICRAPAGALQISFA